MAETIQIISSVVSLAHTLVEACLLLRSTYKTNKGFIDLLDSVTLGIEIELRRLDIWADTWTDGLSNDQYYSRLSDIVARILKKAEDQCNALQSFLQRFAVPPSLSTRLKFILVHKEQLLEHRQALKMTVDDLYTMIPPRRALRLELTLQSTLLQTTSTDELETIVKAAAAGTNGTLPSVAKTKAICLKQSAVEWAAKTTGASNITCKRWELNIKSRWGARSIGTWKEHRVIVEWKIFRPETMSVKDSMSRVYGIAGLLHMTNSYRPVDLMIPSCLGVVEGSMDSGADGAAGILYQIPPECPDTPENLSQLLDAHQKRPDLAETPPLEARRALARTLALALFHLHCAGWLHKGLTPNSVIFFPSASEPSTTRTSNYPWAQSQLIGFEYARPNDPKEISEETAQDENLYRHPSTQGAPRENRFSPAFDLFALGLILLDVGRWEGLRYTEERYAREKHLSKPEARKLLHEHLRDTGRARGIVKELPFMMGTDYFEAVRACLLITPETYSSKAFIDIIQKLETSC